MPIGARPVIELLLKWLRRNGIKDVHITTGYLGHLIRSFCGDGRQWDLKITYTQEHEPLGTIGPLSLLRDELDSTFLVLNGDVLTDLDLKAFAAAHYQNGGMLTVATISRLLPVDYGVIDRDETGRITRFREKPSLANFVSMGAYWMNPEVLSFVPSGVPFGFDDLVLSIMAAGKPVYSYRHHGLWLDIGRVEDFHQAQEIDWTEQVRALGGMAM